ncbi:unnamed protein product [Ilex paraguariensis]|uniref:Uncharacterized protein n=1 Tax=Ilex paraguariensis TaxID=185542 RepID=A0ABC8RP07_9AQUA
MVRVVFYSESSATHSFVSLGSKDSEEEEQAGSSPREIDHPIIDVFEEVLPLVMVVVGEDILRPFEEVPLVRETSITTLAELPLTTEQDPIDVSHSEGRLDPSVRSSPALGGTFLFPEKASGPTIQVSVSSNPFVLVIVGDQQTTGDNSHQPAQFGISPAFLVCLALVVQALLSIIPKEYLYGMGKHF